LSLTNHLHPWLDLTSSDKHSSLLGHGINWGRIKLYDDIATLGKMTFSKMELRLQTLRNVTLSIKALNKVDSA